MDRVKSSLDFLNSNSVPDQLHVFEQNPSVRAGHRAWLSGYSLSGFKSVVIFPENS